MTLSASRKVSWGNGEKLAKNCAKNVVFQLVMCYTEIQKINILLLVCGCFYEKALFVNFNNNSSFRLLFL